MGAKNDRLVVHADETSVADGHAMGVPAEVVQTMWK